MVGGVEFYRRAGFERCRGVRNCFAASGQPQLSTADSAVIKNYKTHIDNATKFIPSWVKVAVALALGMGTMIGWKRIVITVAEKIGKGHLTCGQCAAAEITAMFTIIATYGMTGWRKLPFGSVTDKVVRLADCPVLVLRAQQDRESAKAVKTPDSEPVSR